MTEPARFLSNTSMPLVPARTFGTYAGLARYVREMRADSISLLWIPTFGILGLAIYRLRVNYIVRSMHAHFDERLQERTRMARDLHDRFLETIQGSKLITDDALAAGSDEERMRQALEKLSFWLGQVAVEGNTVLHALNTATTIQSRFAHDIEQFLTDECQPYRVSVAFTIVGDPRKISPVVQDEILFIARQAIQNSCMFSTVTLVHFELHYSYDLRLCLKDNGIKINPDAADAEEINQTRLASMGRRSARIGACLTISNSQNNGTEVILQVPGEVAYRIESKTIAERLRNLIERARLAAGVTSAKRGKDDI